MLLLVFEPPRTISPWESEVAERPEIMEACHLTLIIASLVPDPSLFFFFIVVVFLSRSPVILPEVYWNHPF